jgi:P4 family phage/plasmid primase-like protien
LTDDIIKLLHLQIYNNDNITNNITNNIIKKNKKREIYEINEFTKITPLIFEDIKDLDTNFNKTKYILQLLSNKDEKFYSKYDEWLTIGFAIGTLSNEEPHNETNYLDLYLSFSAQYKYWDIENYNMSCNIFYNSNNTITLGTLIFKLKKYNDAYNKFQDLITKSKFENMVRSPTHGSVSAYYHSLFPDKYIYDDNINKWYLLLDTNIWELLKDHTRRIRYDIKEIITHKINNKIKLIYNIDSAKDLLKKYQKVIDKLNTEDFMKNTFNSLKDYYMKINVKFDELPSLFVFKNGYCFDLSNNKKTIRKINPNDYVTLHTGYDYIDPDNNDIIFVNTFIKQLFETEEEFNFIINSISNVLYGNNKYQKCFFFLGIGANGKTVLLTLLERTFGYYSLKASSTLFTKHDKDSLISPEIVQLKNKRFLHISEPNPDDKIQQSRYKSTTGNEKISARALFSNDIESYIPSFTPFISCNQMPIFEKIDEAIRRRSILIHFKFRFTSKKEFEHDRDIDVTLHEKINNDKIGMAMSHILFNSFNHNYDPAEHLPNTTNTIINEFLSNNDPLYDFLNSNRIDINKDNKEYKIPISFLHSIYVDYIAKEYSDNSVRPLPIRKFTELILNKGFIKTRINTTYILGIKTKI